MNILTFDIGVTNIRYALCDEQFRLSDVHTVPTRAQQGGQQIMERLLEIIGTYQHIDRVAVSTVGQVDSQNGIVVYSAGNIPYYTGMMIKKRITMLCRQNIVPTVLTFSSGIDSGVFG